MANLKFLLDENLPPAIKDALLKRDPRIDIIRVGDATAPPFGTPDEVILDWMANSGYVLVTDNRRSMPRHLQNHYALGKHIPGILLTQRGISLGEIVEELWLIWEVSEASEYRDRIQFIPL